ncbi:glycosyltransferase [Streptomyces sp. NPDC001493]
MRILFSCTPAMGHLLPLLPMERAARRAGHVTAVMTHASLARAAAPASFLPAGPTLAEALAETAARTGLDATAVMSPATVGEFFGGVRVDLALPEALPLARDFAPDLVIAEAADQVGPVLAGALGVAWASHAVGIEIAPELKEAMRNAAGTRAAAVGAAWSAPVAEIDPWPDFLQLPGWTPSVARVPVRPEIHEAEDGPAGPPHDRPSARRPKILISLGTVVDAPGLVEDLIAAMPEDVDVVAALNPGSSARPHVDERRVRLTGFVPMRELLEGVDAVVCSGGAGTVTAALRSGLPLVVLPMGLDKPLNAERVQAFDAGLTVSTAAEAAVAVRRVLAESRFSAAARDASARLAALPSAAQVLDRLLPAAARHGCAV